MPSHEEAIYVVHFRPEYLLTSPPAGLRSWVTTSRPTPSWA